VLDRRGLQPRELERIVSCCIIAPQRRNIAHLRRPWRASIFNELADFCHQAHASRFGYFGRASAQIDEAATLKEQAVKLFNEGRCSDSAPLFKRSLAILDATFGPDHPYVGASLSYLA
jgi:hypothetical protein